MTTSPKSGGARRWFILSASAATAATALLRPAGVSATPLAAYAWRARPLLLFAPTSEDPRLAEQLDRLAPHAAALRDREMPLIVVTTDRAQVDGAAAASTPADIRTYFGVAADQFALRLVGKDTGVKLSADAPVAPSTLFGLVDAMPMRRREMRAHQ